MLNNRPKPYTRIRNVQRVRRPLCDGRYNYHHYHRPTRTKLPGQPGSPEFMAVYEECQRRLTAAGVANEQPKLIENSSSAPGGVALSQPDHRKSAAAPANPRGV